MFYWGSFPLFSLLNAMMCSSPAYLRKKKGAGTASPMDI
jgi:hypothetical protein